MSNYVFAPPPPTDAENNVYATWENGFSKEETDQYIESSKNYDYNTIFKIVEKIIRKIS